MGKRRKKTATHPFAVVDLGIEPYMPRPRGMIREMWRERSFDGKSEPEEGVPPPHKFPKRKAPAILTPAPFQPADVGLQIFPGRARSYFLVTRRGREAKRFLGPAEYPILLQLTKEMRRFARRRSLPPQKWGWVHLEKLVVLLLKRAQSEEHAKGWVRTLILRLRDELFGAIQEVGGTADRQLIIQNEAPTAGQKRSLYRLTILPRNLKLPRS